MEGEKQRLRQHILQSKAPNIVMVDPTVKSQFQRFEPHNIDRLRLQQAQVLAGKVPVSEKLKKEQKKKKKKTKKKKQLKAETEREKRLLKIIEQGQRRDKPGEEVRVVGEPAPGTINVNIPGLAAAIAGLAPRAAPIPPFAAPPPAYAPPAGPPPGLLGRRGSLPLPGRLGSPPRGMPHGLVGPPPIMYARDRPAPALPARADADPIPEIREVAAQIARVEQRLRGDYAHLGEEVDARNRGLHEEFRGRLDAEERFRRQDAEEIRERQAQQDEFLRGLEHASDARHQQMEDRLGQNEVAMAEARHTILEEIARAEQRLRGRGLRRAEDYDDIIIEEFTREQQADERGLPRGRTPAPSFSDSPIPESPSPRSGTPPRRPPMGPRLDPDNVMIQAPRPEPEPSPFSEEELAAAASMEALAAAAPEQAVAPQPERGVVAGGGELDLPPVEVGPRELRLEPASPEREALLFSGQLGGPRGMIRSPERHGLSPQARSPLAGPAGEIRSPRAGTPERRPGTPERRTPSPISDPELEIDEPGDVISMEERLRFEGLGGAEGEEAPPPAGSRMRLVDTQDFLEGFARPPELDIEVSPVRAELARQGQVEQRVEDIQDVEALVAQQQRDVAERDEERQRKFEKRQQIRAHKHSLRSLPSQIEKAEGEERQELIDELQQSQEFFQDPEFKEDEQVQGYLAQAAEALGGAAYSGGAAVGGAAVGAAGIVGRGAIGVAQGVGGAIYERLPEAQDVGAFMGRGAVAGAELAGGAVMEGGRRVIEAGADALGFQDPAPPAAPASPQREVRELDPDVLLEAVEEAEEVGQIQDPAQARIEESNRVYQGSFEELGSAVRPGPRGDRGSRRGLGYRVRNNTDRTIRKIEPGDVVDVIGSEAGEGGQGVYRFDTKTAAGTRVQLPVLDPMVKDGSLIFEKGHRYELGGHFDQEPYGPPPQAGGGEPQSPQEVAEAAEWAELQRQVAEGEEGQEEEEQEED